MTKIVGVGPHYRSFLQHLGKEEPGRLLVFVKPCTTVIQNGMPIEIPADLEKVNAEVEIGIRICRMVRKETLAEVTAVPAIDGLLLCGDITATESHAFGMGKIYDTFTPCSEVVAYHPGQSIRIMGYLNDVVQQDAMSEEMTFNFEEIVAYCSQVLTLEKGDIILSGTPATPFRIQPGDHVRFESPQLGTLIHAVISAS